MGGLQLENQRILATQVCEGDFAEAVMLLKKAPAYAEKVVGPRKDQKGDKKPGDGSKWAVNLATNEGGSSKKSQENVNALLAKKGKETKDKLANQKKKWQSKLKQAKGQKGKGPCFACQGPHMLNECPKWKQLMDGTSRSGTTSGSGNA